MKKHTLNILYSDFAGKKISRNEFEGQVFIYLIRNQSNIITRYWKNDEYEEFISWFYPRLKKGIDSYKETGASF
ncbi:MAG: hypothetical protein LBI04_07895 [Treponema sp.]|jgi:hypothetical protein|nr:hypothetical protein [Treponema sp.]